MYSQLILGQNGWVLGDETVEKVWMIGDGHELMEQFPDREDPQLHAEREPDGVDLHVDISPSDWLVVVTSFGFMNQMDLDETNFR